MMDPQVQNHRPHSIWINVEAKLITVSIPIVDFLFGIKISLQYPHTLLVYFVTVVILQLLETVLSPNFFDYQIPYLCPASRLLRSTASRASNATITILMSSTDNNLTMAVKALLSTSA